MAIFHNSDSSLKKTPTNPLRRTLPSSDTSAVRDTSKKNNRADSSASTEHVRSNKDSLKLPVKTATTIKTDVSGDSKNKSATTSVQKDSLKTLTSKSEPALKSDSISKSKPTSKSEPVSKSEQVSKSKVTAKSESSTKNEPASKSEPSTKSEKTLKKDTTTSVIADAPKRVNAIGKDSSISIIPKPVNGLKVPVKDTAALVKQEKGIVKDTALLLLPTAQIGEKVLGKDSSLLVLSDTSKGGKGLGKDSLKPKKIDSLKIDSTARLQNFKYTRKDSPALGFDTKRQSKFFAQSSLRKRNIEIDSTGKFVRITEKVGEQKVKYQLKVPIDEFLGLKTKSKEDELWDQLVSKYELKSGKKDLSNFMKDLTDFEIPLPSVGVLSIFGAPKISLKLGGKVDIHGAWKSETTEGVTASRLGNTRNEPDFRQQVQINVNGTIGDKLQINADWNTERTFEYENQLKLKYTGYEDEIVQSVEAGNVSLQTASLIGGSDALFGIKANFKMGPLTLTALTSQKKGEVKEKSVSGGSSAQDFTVRAYEYSRNHFFLDQVYADTTVNNLFYRYYGKSTPDVDGSFYVKDIEVWKTINQTLRDPAERNAVAYVSLPDRGETESYADALRSESVVEVPGETIKGRFVKLVQGQDYILHQETGYITFKTNIQEVDAIAVAYRYGAGTGRYYGEFLNQNASDTSKRIILKLIKPQNLQPQYTKAWSLMLKNIYPLNTRNIKKEGFSLDIKYEAATGDPQPLLGNVRLLNAFGFDFVDQVGSAQPDGIFDFRPGVTILPETGEIIFPYLQPFGRNLPSSLADAENLRFNEVYDTALTFAKQNKAKDKFIITGKSTGEASAKYQLGFNLVENSVKVSLNGRELTPGADYTVDYSMGSVEIRNEAALVPGANLKISYEENDLFQIASKTLFGLRGMFDFSKNTKLGFSLLTLSQQTLSDKVRIGEEPLSNSIYGIDFTTSHDMPFLTTLLDNVISTKEMSNFSLRGEAAIMSPNPNTKTSTISTDGGSNVAYIDDFEGSKRVIPVGISYTSWKDISVPDLINPLIDALTPVEKMNYKAKSWWFNVLPSNVNVKNIWPAKRVAAGDEAVTVMDFVYEPTRPGAYNHIPDLTDKSKSWGGMMKLLSNTANNLVEENIEFIEFWVRLQNADSTDTLNIDLGRISEDVIPNSKLDTEDKNLNELIDTGEDTGLDGLTNADEKTVYTSTEGDPSHDDFSYSRSGTYIADDYSSINGTEGNAALTDVGRFPDTEDLNHNGTLEQVNSYYRYKIPLDTTTKNPYIKGGGGSNDKWFLMRVPLKSYSAAVGSPSFTVVDMIRLFVAGSSKRVQFRLAEFNLVGNQWQKLLPKDTVMSLSVVSIEDNPDYNSPPGVQRERDRSRPDQDVYKNEQALKLSFDGLNVGESREAIKYLPRPLYLFDYSKMKLFIHSNDDQKTTSISYFKDTTEYNSDMYFRFGTDTNNYYEYRQPLKQDIANSNWNEISIDFKNLTALKQTRDSANMVYKVPVPGNPGHYYVVRGSPTLTAVKYLSIGVYHRVNANSALLYATNGDIWADELRVIGADDTKGYAYNASATLKLADFITLNANMSHTDPYFHRLSDRFGSRVTSDSWGVSADVDLLKLFASTNPENSLRVNYARTESVGKPLYLPGTDVRVTEARKLTEQKLLAMVDSTNTHIYTAAEAAKIASGVESDAQTINVSESWAVPNIKLKIPSNYWLIRDTWNSLSFGFNYNKTFRRDPTTLANKSWLWNANMNYAVNISPDFSFFPYSIPYVGKVFGLVNDYKTFRIYYLPQSITYNIAAKRSRGYNYLRSLNGLVAKADTARDFGTTRGMSTKWKMTENGFLNINTSYSFDASSSLSYLETDSDLKQRRESRIWQDIFTGAFFGKDYSFNQSIDISTSPRLPSFWDINKFLTITTGYNVRYSWTNDFRVPELGRAIGFQNKASVGLTFKLKGLLDPLFVETPDAPEPASQPAPIIRRPAVETPVTAKSGGAGLDTSKASLNKDIVAKGDTSKVLADTVAKKSKMQILKTSLTYLKYVGKLIFADYESVQVNFGNENTFSSSGIKGNGSGLKNFWNIKYNESEGPTRAYMLGLSRDAGARAPKGNLSDNYSERNSVDWRTSKPLWEGARVDLNWKLGWSMNKSTTLSTDSLSRVSITNVTSTGSMNRSFLTLPPVFIFSFLKSGIKQVNELYQSGSQDQQGLSDAFQQGFETLPWLGKLGFLKAVSKYIPRPNWRFTWEGLERIPLFKSFAKRVSVDHSYSSDYVEGWKLSPDGKKEVQSQKISMGFQPLLGLNVTFLDLWSGNFTGNVKYSTRSGFDLGVTTKNITEDFSKEVGVSLNYAKSGFEVPLFGISLKNDIEFSFSFSTTKTSTIMYDMAAFKDGGVPQNGTTRTSFEPRIKYVISSRVTLAIYYKRSSTQPEGAARISPVTSNEAGLDVSIAIQ